MNVGIDGLMVIAGSWINNEPVIGMDVSSFVRSVISGPEAPRRGSTCVTKITSVIPL